MMRFLVASVLATVMVSTSAMVVMLSCPMHAVLALMVCMMGSAMLWLSLEAEFLALILMIVHGAAVMTMFVYLSMTLDDRVQHRKKFVTYTVGLLLLGVLWCVSLLYVLGQVEYGSDAVVARGFTTRQLGLMWVRDYPEPWLMLGVLLMVAMMACVHVVYRRKRQHEHHSSTHHMQVGVGDRLHFSDRSTERLRCVNDGGHRYE